MSVLALPALRVLRCEREEQRYNGAIRRTVEEAPANKRLMCDGTITCQSREYPAENAPIARCCGCDEEVLRLPYGSSTLAVIVLRSYTLQ